MVRRIAFAALAVFACGMLAQSPASRPKFDAFEVATVKPVIQAKERPLHYHAGYESVCREGLHAEVADRGCLRSQSANHLWWSGMDELRPLRHSCRDAG